MTTVYSMTIERARSASNALVVRAILYGNNEVLDVCEDSSAHIAIEALRSRHSSLAIGVRMPDGSVEYPDCLSLVEALEATYRDVYSTPHAYRYKDATAPLTGGCAICGVAHDEHDALDTGPLEPEFPKYAVLRNITDIPVDEWAECGVDFTDYCNLLDAQNEQQPGTVDCEATKGFYDISLADGTEIAAISEYHLHFITRA